MSNFESIDVRPVQEWISESPTGAAFQIHDPVSGELTDPNAPPSFLFEDMRLALGHQMLRHMDNVTLGMWKTAGEARATDLGRSDEFESALMDEGLNVTILGHTIDGLHPDVEHEDVDNKIRLMQEGRFDEIANTTYHDRITRGIVGAGVGYFSAGLERDPKTQEPLTVVERTIETISGYAQLQAGNPNDRGAAAELTGIVAQNTAQWYRVLKAGYEIGELMKTHNLMAASVLLASPMRDADYDGKFRAAGIEDMYGEVAVPDSLTDKVAMHEKIMRQGYADATDLLK